MQGRASKAVVIEYTGLCQIHINYQLKTAVVDKRDMDSINYLTEVEVKQDVLPPANTPELPQPRKFSSLKSELLALRPPWMACWWFTWRSSTSMASKLGFYR